MSYAALSQEELVRHVQNMPHPDPLVDALGKALEDCLAERYDWELQSLRVEAAHDVLQAQLDATNDVLINITREIDSLLGPK